MHASTMNFPILTAIVLLPVFGAVATAVVSKRRPELVKLVALVSAVATGALSLWLTASFETGEAGFQFVSKHEWIERWGTDVALPATRAAAPSVWR